MHAQCCLPLTLADKRSGDDVPQMSTFSTKFSVSASDSFSVYSLRSFPPIFLYLNIFIFSFKKKTIVFRDNNRIKK